MNLGKAIGSRTDLRGVL